MRQARRSIHNISPWWAVAYPALYIHLIALRFDQSCQRDTEYLSSRLFLKLAEHWVAVMQDISVANLKDSEA